MGLVIAGRIVSLAPADPSTVFNGRQFLDNYGTIDRPTSGNVGVPSGFSITAALDVEIAPLVGS